MKQQYEAMSDRELTCAIIEIVQKDNLTLNYRPHDTIDTAIIYKWCGEWLSLDYCNNPSDMMPLVFESGISLWVTPHDPDNWSAKGYVNLRSKDITKRYSLAVHSNPLRAAAIVYLLMKA